MINPEIPANGFEGNVFVTSKLIADLTHQESLLVPEFGGNCLNWVLGHLIVSRHRALKMLDREPLWTQEQLERYETGSEPITAETALPFDQMMVVFANCAEHIAEALRNLSEEDMSASHGESTVGQRIMGLYWHESYHIGQFELFRRLAGKTEKVFG